MDDKNKSQSGRIMMNEELKWNLYDCCHCHGACLRASCTMHNYMDMPMMIVIISISCSLSLVGHIVLLCAEILFIFFVRFFRLFCYTYISVCSFKQNAQFRYSRRWASDIMKSKKFLISFSGCSQMQIIFQWIKCWIRFLGTGYRAVLGYIILSIILSSSTSICFGSRCIIIALKNFSFSKPIQAR